MSGAPTLEDRVADIEAALRVMFRGETGEQEEAPDEAPSPDQPGAWYPISTVWDCTTESVLLWRDDGSPELAELWYAQGEASTATYTHWQPVKGPE